MKKAITLYQKFWGRGVRAIKKAYIHVPENLVYLGNVHAIEYLSDKWNGGGDGKKAIYRHKFSSGAKLYVDQDEKGKVQLFITGSKIRVNDRGIIN